MRFGYAPTKNWTLNATYYLNDLAIGRGSPASESEYKRLQIDFLVNH